MAVTAEKVPESVLRDPGQRGPATRRAGGQAGGQRARGVAEGVPRKGRENTSGAFRLLVVTN